MISIFAMKNKLINYDYYMICKYTLLVGTIFLTISIVPVFGDTLGKFDPVEPIFTEEAFLEKTLEFDVGIENQDMEKSVEIDIIGSWIFANRLELGLGIPFEYHNPDDEDSVFNLSDLGISAQLLICCPSFNDLLFISLIGNFLFPTGDQNKNIGGTGEWGFSLNSGYFFNVADIAYFGLQLEIAYSQQLRLTDEQKQMADMLGISRTREKDVIWNLALTQQYINNRLTPVIELLGTSIVDALDREEEGTILELGFGIWVIPFSDKSVLNAIGLGAGVKFPITEREASSSSYLFRARYDFN